MREIVASLLVLLAAFLIVVLADVLLRRPLKKNKVQPSVDESPFEREHRCKPSPAEEIWVRHLSNPHPPPKERPLLLEVLHSKDSGQTWEKLPLRLSPWAQFKCAMLDGEWPPASGSRNLSCDDGSISFEVLGADYWEKWPDVWRAIYNPRRRWWTLDVIGPLKLRVQASPPPSRAG